jgi:hypothetical protein
MTAGCSLSEVETTHGRIYMTLRRGHAFDFMSTVLGCMIIAGVSARICQAAWPDTLRMRDDYITASFEQYFSAPVGADSFSAKAAFQNAWAYVGLPGLSVLHKNVFSAVELDFIDRAISHGPKPLNDRGAIMQRYGLFAGATIFDNPGSKGSIMAGGGVASDFSVNDGNIWYLHLIYDHRFVISENLTIGVGVLFQYHFDAWRMPINLLPTIKWQIGPQTQFQVAWDNAEFKQHLFSRVTGIAEVRYDLSFFRLRDKLSYELETVAAGAGADIHLAGNYFLRLRYKNLMFRREIIRLRGIAIEDITGGHGGSVKISFVNAR